jgi:hypothetical protein
MTCTNTALPGWVPPKMADYLAHTTGGRSMRCLARDRGCHASSIMRAVHQIEARRDDPLVDAGLALLSGALTMPKHQKEQPMMTAIRTPDLPSHEDVEKEARRILRRLCESGAVLAVSDKLPKAVVMRDTGGGTPTRTAVVERPIAEAFAINDWIALHKEGRVNSYRITQPGRAALKRLLAADQEDAYANGFAEQHREWGYREVDEEGRKTRKRYNMAESPITTLARRKGADGKPFLAAPLVAAAERLREDFELSQMGPNITQNWESFLTGPMGRRGAGRDPIGGPERARTRVQSAMAALGPGLGDVALRCCCFLEGLEATEKRMGWSARSGKIVLRISLQQLARHYECNAGAVDNMIG